MTRMIEERVVTLILNNINELLPVFQEQHAVGGQYSGEEGWQEVRGDIWRDGGGPWTHCVGLGRPM